MTRHEQPTSRADAFRARAAECLALVLFEGPGNHADAVIVDRLDDGRFRVASTDERASMWDGSIRIYPADAESLALDDALTRARADRRARDGFGRREDDAVDAWRAAGGDAWVRGETGLWLKGVHHSAGPRWQVFRRREDWGSERGNSLGYVSQTPRGYLAIPLTGLPGPAHATSAEAELALEALDQSAADA